MLQSRTVPFYSRKTTRSQNFRVKFTEAVVLGSYLSNFLIHHCWWLPIEAGERRAMFVISVSKATQFIKHLNCFCIIFVVVLLQFK